MRYVKTEAGQAAFKERSTAISPKQRSAFLLFDGKKSLGEVLAATAGLGISSADIEHLIDAGFLVAIDGGAEAAGGAPSGFPPSMLPPSGFAPSTLPPPGFGPSVLPETAAGASPGASAPAASGLTPSDLYARAYPIATRLTAGLGLRGFRLNVAVEKAAGYEDLVALLPKIADAVGADKARELEIALRG